MRPQIKYGLLAFLEGSSVMGTEILCGRWLSAIYGSSLYVWTAILSCTMLALTIGYFLGGRFSQEKINDALLAKQLLLASFGICAIPFLISIIFPLTLSLGLLQASFLVTLLLLAIPFVSLASTTPILGYLMHISRKEELSHSAGFIFSVSTIGGIISTYLIGLFIIELFGVYAPLLVLGSGLALCTLLILKISIRPMIYYFAACLMAIFSSFYFYNPVWASTPGATLLYSGDGIMGNLRVEDINPNGGGMRQLVNNGAVQSSIKRSDLSAVSNLRYVHTIAATASVLPRGSKVLLIGMAGGALVREFQDLGFSIDVVDIDDRTYDLAKEYFYLDTTNVHFIEDDGRHFIKNCPARYDLAVIDISTSDSQPYYLYSYESFKEFKSILNPKGLLVINYIDFVYANKAHTTAQIIKSLEAAEFFCLINNQVYKGIDLTGLSLGHLQEKIILASQNEPFNTHRLDKSKMNACCLLQATSLDFMDPDYTAFSDSVEIIYDDRNTLDRDKMEIVHLYRIRNFSQFK